MRILVTGRTGQLATSLSEQARGTSVELINRGRPALDLERPSEAAARIKHLRPNLVVNAAAYTAVDRAEAEPDRAFAVNRDGAAAAARAAAQLGVPFIHISTDYVFDGAKRTPYVETDKTGPINIYGASKLAGEEAVLAAHPHALILRTSWVFSPFGSNFVKTMLTAGATRPVLRVVSDQAGNPTSALDLASAILAIAPRLRDEAGGVFHYAGGGATSWYGFADAIFAESRKLGGPSPDLQAITTEEYPTPARRPANSRLDCSAFVARFGVTPRPWLEDLPQVVTRLLSAHGEGTQS